MAFTPGWHPDFAAAALSDIHRTGRYCTVAPPTKPLSPARFLTEFRLNFYVQGDAGTCWIHGPKQGAEIMANALGYKAFPICRRLIGWYGKNQFEGGGNPSEGGSGYDAIRSMAAADCGLAHEDLCPYTDNARTLGTKPGQAVWADAVKSHVIAPVVVQPDPVQIQTMIDNFRPVPIGIWWPYGWDNQQTVMNAIGPGEYGHEICIVGYIQPKVIGNSETLYGLDNSHGKLYPPLPPQLAKLIQGYKPIALDFTSEFLVPESLLFQVINMGSAELSSMTDFDGIDKGIVAPAPGFDSVFPV